MDQAEADMGHKVMSEAMTGKSLVQSLTCKTCHKENESSIGPAYTEVAKKVNVSQGTIHVRMAKMEEAGILDKTTLKINYANLGYDITAFIGIYLEKSALYDKVLTKLKDIPEIVSIHYTTGNYSMFLKIHCRDTN
ncbi:MAG: Lrp/AsnC ligand binding domain-containing protein, partial [bacterium]